MNSTTFSPKMNVNNALTLVEETPVEDEANKARFITIELKCRAGATSASAISYKKHIRLFEGGTPQEFVDGYRAIQEVWTQNNITTPADRINIVRMVFKGESFTTFEEAITVLQGEGELTNEIVDLAMDEIAVATFPHRALFHQKRWMSNGMRKPRALSTRQTVASLTKMNNALPYFPGASAEDKFKEDELIQIMEWMVPQEFRQKFDEKGYIPTDHDRKRFIDECEIVERLQASRAKSTPQQKPKNSQKFPGKARSKTPNRKKKYCLHHGADKGHTSEECWTLHPELKPAPKGPNLSNNKMRKEINHLARVEKKTELDIVNHKIEQLQKAKASYERRDKKKESHNLEKEELTDSDSISTQSSKSIRMMEVEQPIPKKRLTKIGEVPKKEKAKATSEEEEKKMMAKPSKKKKRDLFEMVNPDEAARQQKIRAFKIKMGIIQEDEDSFAKAAKKISEEVDLSKE